MGRPLDLVTGWPVDQASAAIVCPGGTVATHGDQSRVYRLASIAKVITAWALLVAVEEGVMDLDEVPRGVQEGCTLRHLLSHAGGYPFEGRQPIAAPGRTRTYSNGGIELAVEALEAASGMPFADYLAEAVLEPLGMRDTSLRGSPAHAVYGSSADVAAFAGELLRPRLLHSETADQARSVQFPDLAGIVPGIGRFDPMPWGLGVEIAGDKSPHWTGTRRSPATFGHFGGAGTMMWVDPVADVALVALTDRPFDDWPDEAVRSWAALSDSVLEDTAVGRS